MWTTVQHFLHVSDLTLMTHRIRMLLHLSSLRRRSRINPKNTATLAVGMKLNPGLPRINLMTNPMNLRSHLLNLKNTLDKNKHKSRSRYVSSSSEEDQSSVARHRSSKPSGAQPSGAASDQDLPQHDPDPPYYREVALTFPHSTLKRSTLLGAFFPSLTPGSLCLGPQLQSWVWPSRAQT